MTKLIETKVLLIESEDLILQQLAKDAGMSKTKFCTKEIRKLIKKSEKQVPYSKEQIDNFNNNA